MKYLICGLLVLLSLNISYSNDTLCHINHKYDLERLRNDVVEIRRDQLNYKLEKDLLKETYSSNYTTIQIIISLILGVFAILGYLGLKSILNLKNEYDLELTKLKELKSGFETKLLELNETQNNVKTQIEHIDTLNEEQNKKIRLLEIKEKVGSWMGQNGFQRALEYITIGLMNDENDIELLINRAFALFKLRSYPEAIETYKRILSIDANSKVAIHNLAELYLIIGQLKNYEELIKNKLDHLDYHSVLVYFESFKLLYEKRSDDLRKLISEFIDKNDLLINKNYLNRWDTTELNEAMEKFEDNNDKALFRTFSNYLKGLVPGNMVKTLLTQP